MTKTDRDALKRAIELAKTEDEGRSRQIEAMLREDGFEYAGTFAAYCCQTRSLRLKPWQIPPSVASAEPADERRGDGNQAALALARRLEAARLSIYEPDPLAALMALEGQAPAA